MDDSWLEAAYEERYVNDLEEFELRQLDADRDAGEFDDLYDEDDEE